MDVGEYRRREGEFEEKSPVGWTKEKGRDGEGNDGRNGSEGGKNIRECEGRFQRHGGGEKEREIGGENTHTKVSSSDPDLRRQGNRWRANFGRKPRNFCSNFHRCGLR